MLCIDTSAWHHRQHAVVQARWVELLAADQLAICDQVRLEILYSARSHPDYQDLAEELGGLHEIKMDAATFRRALEVQALLAATGGLHHRSVTIADLLVASAAEAAQAVVWHYDEDFDRIAGVTGQPTEWVAPRGSLSET